MKRPDGPQTFARVHGPPARGTFYLGLCAVLAVIAVLLIGRFLTSSPAPSAANKIGAIPAPMRGPSQTVPAAPDAPTPLATANVPQPFHLVASTPVSVHIPSINIRSDLLKVGLNKDKTIEVPSTAAQAAWYRLGPTPGALGPAIVVGHVDSDQGPGVFYTLGSLRPGQTIDVTRADKSVAHFRVDAVDTYTKNQFPTEAVYGPINYAGLRLITCGGQFDTKIHHYTSNVVAFASLIRP